MAKKDPRVDAYIKRAQPFARPILTHLRKLVHKACPDVKETIKWQMPFFERNGIICFIAGFKQHCSFDFWQGKKIFGKGKTGAMGDFGRITSIEDLPNAKTLIAYVRKAAELNEVGVKGSPPRSRAKQKLIVPPDFKTALAKDAKARKTFDNFSY